MSKIRFLLVLRIRVWRRRVLHVVISLSGAWERPAGDTPPAGYLRNIEPVAGRV